MRCLALAAAWRSRGGQAAFLSHCPSPGLRDRIDAVGAALWAVEPDQTRPEPLAAALARCGTARSDKTTSPPWVVLDGYHFDPGCQEAARSHGRRLLVIDDLVHWPCYNADLVLNQNAGAEQSDYRCTEGTNLLLGTKFLVLRPEFQAWRDWERSIPARARRLLVTLGGSDPLNATATILEGLRGAGLDDLEVRVVLGAANPHARAVRDRLPESPAKMQFLTNVTDMAEQMAWADVAVSAAGTTAWELAFMQLPAVLVEIVEHQQRVARPLSQIGAAEGLGPAAGLDPKTVAHALEHLCGDASRRAAMARSGRALSDGRGAERVVAIMQALEGPLPADALQIRPAASEDLWSVWRLSNEPTVRENSLSTEPISRETHVDWYRRRLASPDARIWLLELQGLVLGQVRYERVEPQVLQLSLSVSGAWRRRGLGTRLVQETWRRACQEMGATRLRAVVRQENGPSARTFGRLGFARVGSQIVGRRPCHIFEVSM